MQKDELLGFKSPKMQNIVGECELMCSCHLVSTLAPSPINKLVF